MWEKILKNDVLLKEPIYGDVAFYIIYDPRKISYREAAKTATGHYHSRSEARMDLFDKWNKSVIDFVPKERLLVYHPKDGWEPLCEFLNLPIPSISYPHLNKTKNMGHMSRFINSMFILIILAIIGVILSSVFWGITYFQ